MICIRSSFWCIGYICQYEFIIGYIYYAWQLIISMVFFTHDFYFNVLVVKYSPRGGQQRLLTPRHKPTVKVINQGVTDHCQQHQPHQKDQGSCRTVLDNLPQWCELGTFYINKKLHVSKGLEEFIRQLKQRLGPPVYIGAFLWRMFSLTGMIPAMKQSEIRRRQKRERAILRGQVGLHQALYVTMFTKHCSLFRRPINRRFFSVPKWPV